MMKRVNFGHLKAAFTRRSKAKHQLGGSGCLHANGDALGKLNKEAETEKSSFESECEPASCTVNVTERSNEKGLTQNRSKGKKKTILTALRWKWRKSTRKKRRENRHSLVCDSRISRSQIPHSENSDVGVGLIQNSSFTSQKPRSKQTKSLTRGAVCPMPSPIHCVRRESSSLYENEENSDQSASAVSTNETVTVRQVGISLIEPKEVRPVTGVTDRDLCTNCSCNSKPILKCCGTDTSVSCSCDKNIDDFFKNMETKQSTNISSNRNSTTIELEKCVDKFPDSKAYSSPSTSSHPIQGNKEDHLNNISSNSIEKNKIELHVKVQKSKNELNVSKSSEIPPDSSSLALDVPSSCTEFQCKQAVFNVYADVPDSPKTVSITEELFKLSKCGWYWGPITRSEAEEKLSDQPDGAFLVRDSSDDRYLLSLSFRSYGRTLHTRIEHCNGLFSFYAQPEPEGHSSIVDLIEQSMNYSQSGVFCYSRSRYRGSPSFPVRLTKAMSRFTQVRTLQYLCRFVIRQYTRFDHIQHLPLPARIKGYLEEGHY
ncbi:uncharacterized protein LOC106465027 [Limulus polyphemus]|uniref:Uncharacterized protein LOC106465027 n=1 Tax=Limulus polyphemus TaxID=6850 RepID=A0ABM1BF12_LIMPO|nr:uncharacterized protein LOC106465027 [Limulus polyphemus]